MPPADHDSSDEDEHPVDKLILQKAASRSAAAAAAAAAAVAQQQEQQEQEQQEQEPGQRPRKKRRQQRQSDSPSGGTPRDGSAGVDAADGSGGAADASPADGNGEAALGDGATAQRRKKRKKKSQQPTDAASSPPDDDDASAAVAGEPPPPGDTLGADAEEGAGPSAGRPRKRAKRSKANGAASGSAAAPIDLAAACGDDDDGSFVQIVNVAGDDADAVDNGDSGEVVVVDGETMEAESVAARAAGGAAAARGSGAGPSAASTAAAGPVGVVLVEGTADLVRDTELQKLLRQPRYFEDAPAIRDSRRCFNCGRVGHAARECTNAARLKPCHLCAQLGHNGMECPNRLCYKCGRTGHVIRDCPYSAADSKISVVCLRCGRADCPCAGKGDYFRYEGNCPNSYSQHDLNYVRCMVCGGYGHLACRSTPKEPATISCYNCGKQGHLGDDCPQGHRQHLLAERKGDSARAAQLLVDSLMQAEHSQQGRDQGRDRRHSMPALGDGGGVHRSYSEGVFGRQQVAQQLPSYNRYPHTYGAQQPSAQAASQLVFQQPVQYQQQQPQYQQQQQQQPPVFGRVEDRGRWGDAGGGGGGRWGPQMPQYQQQLQQQQQQPASAWGQQPVAGYAPALGGRWSNQPSPQQPPHLQQYGSFQRNRLPQW